jgi:DNA mismatch endonuclease, patch repair protein
MPSPYVPPASVRRRMQAVRRKDTNPELQVRKLLFSLGHRYRLHVSDLPGSPDIVLASRRKVIFVNGCFWHGHTCRRGRLPKTRADYWAARIKQNRTRDKQVLASLEEAGWEHLTIWECELRQPEELSAKLKLFLRRRSQDDTASSRHR